LAKSNRRYHTASLVRGEESLLSHTHTLIPTHSRVFLLVCVPVSVNTRNTSVTRERERERGGGGGE
jgi:hypothetical protein